ncbi:hypothetical protein LCGC14_1612210, partial [marine sediment metagenome]
MGIQKGLDIMKLGRITIAVAALVMVTANVASADRPSVPGDTVMVLDDYRLLGPGDDFPGMWEYAYSAVGTTDAGGSNYTHFSDGYLNGLNVDNIVNRWKSPGWYNPDGVVDDLGDPFGSRDDYYVADPILWDPATATDSWNYRVRQIWCANSAGIPRQWGGGLYPQLWPSTWGQEEAFPGGPLIGAWIEPTDPSWDSTSWAYDNEWRAGTAYGQGNILFPRGGVSHSTRTQEWVNSGADGIVGPVSVDPGPDGIPDNEDDTYVDDDFYTYYVSDHNTDEVWFENTSGILNYFGSTGLFMTVRIVSSDSPGEITGGTYHTGGQRVTDTLLGPEPSVGVLGDFTGDGFVDADDITELCANLGDAAYDLDGDGDADEADMIFLIENLVGLTDGVRAGTKRGDFNLDGLIDGTDLALMKTAFGLPDQNYADGNANCDAFVDGTDLAILKTNFGFIA